MINLGKIKKVLAFAFLVSQFSEAQVIPGNMAPELKTKAAVDSNGIDLVGGEPLIGGINMSIGPNTGGTSVVDNSFNGLRTNYRGSIRVLTSNGSLTDCEKLPAGSFYSVTNGKETAIFKAVSSTVFTLHRGRGKLTYDSVNYIYTDLAGVEYKYEKFTLSYGETYSNTTACSISPLATMTKITMPSGEVIDINYITGGHFDSVVSSLGWMFKRDHISLFGDAKTTAGQTTKNSFTFINRAEEYCGVGAASSCTNLSNIWSKYSLEQNYSKVGNQSGFISSPATISYNGLLTNPNGKTTRLNYSYTKPTAFYDTFLTSPTGLVKTYRKKLCDMNGQIVTEEDCSTLNSKRVVKFFQGAASFDYILGFYTGGPSYNEPPNLIPHEAKGPDGTVLYIPVVSSYPYAFFDDLSRSYTQSYTSSWLLEEVGYLNDSRTKAVYDSRGNLTSITQLPKVTGATPLTTSFTYPPESTCTTSPKTCNKPTTITESNGVTTTYTYHPQSGYVETVTKPAVNNIQAQMRYKYEQKTPYVKNSSGNLVANPAVWVLTEVSECMTKTLNTCVGTADEKRVTYSDFTNNLLSQKTTVQDGAGIVKMETLTEYDIYGNVVAVDGPRTGTDDKVFYFYDLMRQKVGEIGVDPDGTGPLPRQAIKTVYNDDGKVVSVNSGVTFGTTKADLDAMTVKQQAATEYSTDHGLPTVERFYAAGVLEKVTQKSYDNKLRLECVAQRLNRSAWSSLPSSACTLGAAGSEGNDRITKYTYDATGAVLSTISAFGTPLQRTDRTNTYSPVNGLLTAEADAKGNTTAYKYDDFNRLFKTVYPTPANGTVESTTDFTQTNYKSGSSLVDSVRLRDGLTINFSEYDALGRVKTKSGALSESFTYNNFNQVASHTNNSTGGVSQTSTYVFNSLGWLKSETRVAGGVSLGSVSYGHDSTGRRTTLTWPDFVFVKYDYNVNNTPSEYLRKITESNGTLLAQFDYYDNGRRKSLTRGNGVVTSYTYNDQYQLRTQSTDVGGSNTADDITETFGYTLSGQLKTHLLNVSNANYKYTPSTAAATNYVPDALNRIASVNGASFGYDGRGNLTQDNTGTTYTYNANNLLLNATKSGVTTTLSYDAENRLYYVGKSGAATKFMYDGTDLIAETSAGNAILRRYVHGPETDDPIVWYEGSGTGDKRYYTANRQGSIVGVTLQNGLSTSVNSYDEYGIQKLSTIGRFQYTGQTWIPEVGLYYYKARFYNPNLGRFMQTDPIGYKDGMNWYAYVGGDPVNQTDPTGMFGYYPGFNELSAQYSNAAITSTVIDFTPGVGDAKAIGEAIVNPSAVNITAAAVGIVPVIGDAAGKAIKTGEKLKSLTSKTNVGEVVKTPDNSKESFTKLKGGQGYKENKTGTIMQRSNTNHSNSPGGEFKAGTKPGEIPEPSKKVTISGGTDGGCVLKKDGCK